MVHGKSFSTSLEEELGETSPPFNQRKQTVSVGSPLVGIVLLQFIGKYRNNKTIILVLWMILDEDSASDQLLSIAVHPTIDISTK